MTDKFAEQLFGPPIKKVKATGDHEPDFSVIQEGFDNHDSIMHGFCRGCGFKMELNEKEVERAELRSGHKRPEVIDCIVVFGACRSCDSRDDKVEFVTKN